ncbi:tyrosine phosphatase [Biscogniauxia mediterranea]|nr:tyrosine phosphatase [Biscogniauxia mediterranea]
MATSTPTTFTLPSPPFVDIPGLPNFRDAGGYPVITPSSSSGTEASAGPKMVRRGVLYRSSEPSGVSEGNGGVAALQRLGIREVFDLRSETEITRGLGGSAKQQQQNHDDHHDEKEKEKAEVEGGEGEGKGGVVEEELATKGWKIKEWEGARRVYVPVFLDLDYSPEALALRYKNYTTDSDEGFVSAYKDILAAASSADNTFQPFKRILEHLAAPSGAPAPCLVHCTAGKDRTGVVCALALSLCGVPDQVVAHEYSLTELGLRPRFAELVSHIRNIPELRDNIEGAKRMLGSRKESMLRTLAWIREKYGSVEGCVTELGFLTPGGIAQLRKNLIVDASEGEVNPWEEHAKLI